MDKPEVSIVVDSETFANDPAGHVIAKMVQMIAESNSVTQRLVQFLCDDNTRLRKELQQEKENQIYIRAQCHELQDMVSSLTFRSQQPDKTKTSAGKD